MIDRIRNNAFARNSLILFAGSMVANVISYVFHLIVGRMVSVEVYGSAQSLNSLMSIIMVPGMTIAMVATKFSAHSRAEDNKRETFEIFKYLSKKMAIYGLPVFLVIILLTPFIADFLNIDQMIPLVLVWVMMFLSFFSSIASGILTGWQKFEKASWAGIWGAVVKLISGVVLVKIGFELSGIIGSFFLASLASYLVMLFALKFVFAEKNQPKEIHEEVFDFAPLKKFILPVFVGNLAMNILGNADMVLAKHSLDSTIAGQYGALNIVSKIIFFVMGVIPSVLFAMSSESHHKKGNTLGILRNASLIMAFVSICSLVAYFIFPNLILRLLFGLKYDAVAPYLGYFAIVVVLFSFASLLLQYLLSIHKTRSAWAFLVISLGMVFVILLIGESLPVILAIAGVSQILAIIAGLYFLFKKHE
jgi:O-antigen/teichoic acid export membrane protein